jgi:twitching motility protein PilT
MGSTDTITLNRILTTAASWHASDLHLLVGSAPIIRVEGKLKNLEDEEIISADFTEAVVGTFLSEEQRQRLDREKELVISSSINPQVRFKVSVYYQRGSLALSLHFVSSKPARLSDLGLPAAVTDFAKLNKGLVLVTGAYGSGRTSTVNALIHEINETRNVNIITIEQPIEYLFVNNKSVVEQREVGRDALSFEQAISTASREDVDVIMVSETETRPVLAAILDAAEASRLVISTMNTDSVLATIEKILNMFPAGEQAKTRTQLSNVLAGIVSQHLVPKIGGGVVLVVDVIIPTPPIRAVIRDGALVQLANVLQTSRQAGLVSLDRSLAQLVAAGTISNEDALVHAQDPASFKGRAQTTVVN